MASQQVPRAPEPPVPCRYLAFISYSHHDQAIAKRIQRQLESYRLPRYLVGRQTSVGTVPSRIGPVFRDREELRASSDLKASVEEALLQSRWMVVICSPHAARSEWVNREITEFKRLHNGACEQRVLALVVSGEPFASRLAGRESEECFPPALRFATLPCDGQTVQGTPLEPLAADLRQHGDGSRHALLKLLATMLGVGFDELIRRDLQRRIRWLAGMVMASLAGAVLLAWLTVLAEQARSDAEHQRANAEDLIEFMLVDLRKQLDAVGRLDVLDAVGTKIMARYARSDGDPGDEPQGWSHRARAQHLIGEIRQQRGKLAEALDAYQSAALITAALLAQQPHDPKRIFDHAQSLFWVGSIAHDRYDHALAERNFLQYLDLATQLLALDANKREWQIEWAYAKQALAVLWLKADRFDEALTALNEARRVFQRWVPTQPSLAFDLAHVLGWTARAYKGLRDYDRALAIQREKEQLFKNLPDASRNQQAQMGLVNASGEIAILLLLQSHADEARQKATATVTQASALVQSEPGNAVWLQELCFSRMTLAEALLALGRPSEAVEESKTIEEELNRLLKIDASNTAWNVALAGRLLVLQALTQPADTSLQGRMTRYLAAARQQDSKRLGSVHRMQIAKVELAFAGLASSQKLDHTSWQHPRHAASRKTSSNGSGSNSTKTVKGNMYATQ
jgi:tetratricopeptide (TPR) repeat protein